MLEFLFEKKDIVEIIIPFLNVIVLAYVTFIGYSFNNEFSLKKDWRNYWANLLLKSSRNLNSTITDRISANYEFARLPQEEKEKQASKYQTILDEANILFSKSAHELNMYAEFCPKSKDAIKDAIDEINNALSKISEDQKNDGKFDPSELIEPQKKFNIKIKEAHSEILEIK